jgi:hypothetical protein
MTTYNIDNNLVQANEAEKVDVRNFNAMESRIFIRKQKMEKFHFNPRNNPDRLPNQIFPFPV